MTDTTHTPRVAFLTLGCPKNEVDSDKMRAAVVSSAYELVDEFDVADVVVINTCSFIREATEESISTVLDVASEWLPKGDRHLIVSGCMPSRYGDDLEQSMPEVSAFLPVAEQSGLLGVIERLTGVSPGASHDAITRTVTGATAYLQISDGCHRSCTYCTIPTIRGPYRSRALAEVIAEATELVEAGAAEIVLIGQDITAYGRDLEEDVVLADVVRAVAAVDGVRWLRLMYAQPDGVTDELLAAMAECDNVCRYLDMPLQHASKDVLRAMHRSGDAESYLALLDRVRTALPGVVLRTTFIAGFPGETASDVRVLADFIEKARFDYVGVFPYSQEEGTVAGEMVPQIPPRTRRARAQKLRDLADTIGFQKAAERIGDTVEVLVESHDPDEGVMVGRWRGQAPDIDGIVMLDRGEPQTFVSAHIVDSICYDLEAEVV